MATKRGVANPLMDSVKAMKQLQQSAAFNNLTNLMKDTTYASEIVKPGVVGKDSVMVKKQPRVRPAKSKMLKAKTVAAPKKVKSAVANKPKALLGRKL